MDIFHHILSCVGAIISIWCRGGYSYLMQEKKYFSNRIFHPRVDISIWCRGQIFFHLVQECFLYRSIFWILWRGLSFIWCRSVCFAWASFSWPSFIHHQPPFLRNIEICSSDCFKEQLDDCLSSIPDESAVPGLIPSAKWSAMMRNWPIPFSSSGQWKPDDSKYFF